MKAVSIKPNRSQFKREVQGWLLTSPYLIFSIIFFLIPLLWSIYLVFQQWDLISPTPLFVGLANFKEALTSPRVWVAFLNTYKFMFLLVPAVTIASIGVTGETSTQVCSNLHERIWVKGIPVLRG